MVGNGKGACKSISKGRKSAGSVLSPGVPRWRCVAPGLVSIKPSVGAGVEGDELEEGGLRVGQGGGQIPHLSRTHSSAETARPRISDTSLSIKRS